MSNNVNRGPLVKEKEKLIKAVATMKKVLKPPPK